MGIRDIDYSDLEYIINPDSSKIEILFAVALVGVILYEEEKEKEKENAASMEEEKAASMEEEKEEEENAASMEQIDERVGEKRSKIVNTDHFDTRSFASVHENDRTGKRPIVGQSKSDMHIFGGIPENDPASTSRKSKRMHTFLQKRWKRLDEKGIFNRPLDISKGERSMRDNSSNKKKPMVQYPANMSREEILKRERLLKRPMRDDDSEDEENSFGISDEDDSSYSMEEEEKEEEEEAAPIKSKTRKRGSIKDKTSSSSTPPPDLPIEFKNLIHDMGGYDIKLLIQKKLHKSDVIQRSTRLTIPSGQVLNRDFLTRSEIEIINTRTCSDNLMGVDVLVIKPSLEKVRLIFKKWDMAKKNRNSAVSSSYVLAGKWYKEVVQKNHLIIDLVLQVWSFRINGELCFALVEVPKEEEEEEEEEEKKE